MILFPYYRRVDSAFQSKDFPLVRICIDMQVEAGNVGWTAAGWINVLDERLVEIVKDPSQWFLSYVVFMDAVL